MEGALLPPEKKTVQEPTDGSSSNWGGGFVYPGDMGIRAGTTEHRSPAKGRNNAKAAVGKRKE